MALVKRSHFTKEPPPFMPLESIHGADFSFHSIGNVHPCEVLMKRRLTTSLLALAASVPVFVATPAHADSWTDEQRQLGASLAGLYIVNWAQERSRGLGAVDGGSAKHVPPSPDRAHAASVGLSAPSSNALPDRQGRATGQLDGRFIAGAIGGFLVLDCLPADYRSAALRAGLVIEASVIANNVRLGVGFRF